jgi:hypothetical protein
LNTTSVTSGEGTVCPSGEHEFIQCFNGVHVTQSLVFCVVFCTSHFCILVIVFLSYLRFLITPSVSSIRSFKYDSQKFKTNIINEYQVTRVHKWNSMRYRTWRKTHVKYMWKRKLNCRRNCCHKCSHWIYILIRVMLLNATFNNISVISWRSVLLME